MKIAIIADPEIPVPPTLYGGIERIIFMLVESYVHYGHEVSLFAHADSMCKAKLFPYKGKSSRRIKDIFRNSYLINRELFLNDYDIVHSFGRLLYIVPQLPFKTVKIMSYQREPTITQIKKAVKLSKKNTLYFTGCSGFISQKIQPFAPVYTVFNGIDLNHYSFKESVVKEAPLIFLGRIEPIKGTHIAINVAKKTGKKLVIAGNIPTEYQSYFETQIKPNLDEDIIYVGPVDDLQKNRLLGKSLALLMPIIWDEPFGIVMAEAMACGTPVIGFNRGSISEIVIDGYNGFKCNDIKEMIEAVNNLNKINRIHVREDAETRFSSQQISAQYLSLYEKSLM